MSEQTEKVYRWLPWTVAAALVIAVAYAAVSFNINRFNIYSLIPWESAQSVDTIRAIYEFRNGVPDTAPYWEGRIAALAGLLVLFVIGPSLWVYSEIRNRSKEISSGDDELKKGFGWYAGVMIIMAGLLYAVPVTAMKGYYFQNSWESAAKSRNMDELRSGLMSLAFDVAEQYYLSRGTGATGGFEAVPAGDGSFRPLTLDDLDSYGEAAGSGNSFLLAPPESDSVITIYGIGYREGSDPGFRNANGEQGRIQLALKVVPHGDIVQWSDADTN